MRVSRLHRGFAAARRRPLLAFAALLFSCLSVVAAAWGPAESLTSVLVLSCVAAGVAGVAAWLLPALRTSALAVAAVGCHLVVVVSLLVGQLSVLAGLTGHSELWVMLALAYTTATVAAGAAAVRLTALRPGAAGCASLFALLGVLAATHASSAVAAGVFALLVAVLAGWRRGHGEEWTLAGGWVLAVLTSVGYAATAAAHADLLTAAVLAGAGLTALVYGLLPSRGNTAVAGALLCSAATWTLMAGRDVTTVEAYSLPLAALIGIVGLVRLHRSRKSPSWLTVGPALTAALLPSALATIGDRHLTRPLLVLGAAAVVLVGGVLLRWQSPVVTGTLSLIVVASAQLGPYAVGLPRWLSFGVVGVVLLLLGVRYEQRRRNARGAARWVSSLQ